MKAICKSALIFAAAAAMLPCRPARLSAENEKIKFNLTDADTRSTVPATDTSAMHETVSIHLYDSDMYIIKIDDKNKSMVYISYLQLDSPEQNDCSDDEVTLRLVTEGPEGRQEETIIIQ